MEARIVGVDCAVQPNRVGVALAVLEGSRCRVLEARQFSPRNLPFEAILSWHRESSISLLALDSPLGWPVGMGKTLNTHQAGAGIGLTADQLFRRETDLDIYRRLGKHPLDVGANFIARTARASLGLLEELRSKTGEPIPLAWEMSVPERLAAIEVYPAATLRAMNLPLVSYKKKSELKGRRKIMESLPGWFDLAEVHQAALDSADVLDAILCTLAGVQFCRGHCVPPRDLATAQKEGWIWG